MDLSVVIVTHNSRAPVKECLASLDRHRPSCEHETIVVDNASSDGTPAMVAGEFGWVRLVENSENTGYSRGVNQGIRLSCGRKILVLNPDIQIQEGSIDALVSFMDTTPDAGIVGAKLLYPDGRLQYSCRTFYTMQVLLLRRTFVGKLFPGARALHKHLMKEFDHETSRKVDWIIGACMMVRRDAIEDVGSMDERFFLYFEDIDWCYRMKNSGWAVYYVPQSVMIHTYERSSARSVLRKPFVIHLLSLLRYYEKWNHIFYLLRRHRGAFKSVVFVLSDLVAINASFFAAYYLRGLLQPLFINKLYPLDWYYFFILFYNLVFLLAFLLGGLYRIRRETVWIEEFSRLARALFLGLAVLLASTYLTSIRIYSRAVVIGHVVFAICAAGAFRRAVRALHRELVKANFDLKSVLLIGGEDEARRISQRFALHPELGINIVGHAGDGEHSLGSIEELPEIVERFKVQEVIVLPSYQEHGGIFPYVVLSSGRMIQVRVVSALARYFGGDVRVDELAGVHVFSIERGAMHIARRACKRGMDLILSLILIPVSAVCTAACYLYGRLTKRVRFFHEIRCGARGKNFHWPRVVGASGREAGDLCKVLLFVDLLIGRLSLVGPPPMHPSWSLEATSAGMRNVQPGITGKWRFTPYESWSKAIENELYQSQRYSLTEELMILLRSVTCIFAGKYPGWFNVNGRLS